MDRRRILLVVAVLVAALGSALVFLYTKGADTRAEEKFDTVEVLKATAVIAPGEKFEDAQAAGKLALQAVSQDSLLDGYQTTTDSLGGTVSLGTIYPGEQIISAKFGTSVAVQSSLADPGRQDGDLGQPHRPGAGRGLRQPGLRGRDLRHGTAKSIDPTGEAAGPELPFSRLLLERVTVLGVGTTTPVSTTTTDETGASTTEQLPRTLLTARRRPAQAQKVLFAQANGELAFGLLTDKSTVAPAPGDDRRQPLQVRRPCPSSLTPTRWSWSPCWRPCRPGPTASSPSTGSTPGSARTPTSTSSSSGPPSPTRSRSPPARCCAPPLRRSARSSPASTSTASCWPPP